MTVARNIRVRASTRARAHLRTQRPREGDRVRFNPADWNRGDPGHELGVPDREATVEGVDPYGYVHVREDSGVDYDIPHYELVRVIRRRR
jgi:hypothetical protein